MAELPQPFDFRACLMVLKSTGKKASSLGELRTHIGEVGQGSLFHHTYQYFLKGHVLDYTNDFAQWAGESLEERALAEQLSNIDPYAFPSIEDLRTGLMQAMDDYLLHSPEPRQATEGQEFYFNETVTLVFPIGIRVGNLAEFLAAIKYVDPAAIYYHFFEARIRLNEGTGGNDDFSRWIGETLGKSELANRLRGIDPFMHSLEDNRGLIAQEVE
ncbi:MAG TPA: hypothetical protein DCR97_00670, partial [Deltaproteobacteria bacterium]|nr:hypothetical protein [Deltaproteobacteria bacterium]